LSVLSAGRPTSIAKVATWSVLAVGTGGWPRSLEKHCTNPSEKK